MSDSLNALLRSVIESITEFLPVSSTGHLFLFSSFFPFSGFGENNAAFDDLFDIFIQTGAILSVVFLYFFHLKAELFSSIRFLTGKSKEKAGIHFYLTLGVGALPVLLSGFLFKSFLDEIKSKEYLLLLLGLAWLAGGIAILVVENKFAANKSETSGSEDVSLFQAMMIGLIQCIALIPGVSRSLATITAGRFFGLTKRKSAEFSFYVAIPVLFAAGLYKLYKHRILLQNQELILILILGFFISFLLCLFVIKWFLFYLKKYSFDIFGYYRIILGFSVIIYYFSSGSR
ncbi:MAG: undecaprenyl-diphosphate phosphatase [Leptospira sp.]|nr:undecaprenyl-diphosphate phosphatase [Leptospira sp.]